MAKIDTYTEQRIKAAASIVDVADELGITLYRKGKDYSCLCPFHDDHSLGNAVISTGKNIFKCFSCNETKDPIGLLMWGKNLDYPDALRYLAEMYHITIDGDDYSHKPKRPTTIHRAPRTPQDSLPLLVLNKSLVTARMSTVVPVGNEFVNWFRSLPFNDDDYKEELLKLYLVGTGDNGYTKGWTLWWYVDADMNVRTGKLMKYQPDGHRDKSVNPQWVHTLIKKAGRWDDTKQRYETCLFGLHLADCFKRYEGKEIEVHIVESEKTAMVCQMYAKPTQRIYMATGGMQFLNRRTLMPLINRGRKIVLDPDIDGIEDWERKAKEIHYDRLSVSREVLKLYDAEKDGAKADMADCLVRKAREVAERSTVKEVHDALGLTEPIKPLDRLINKFNLELQQ